MNISRAGALVKKALSELEPYLVGGQALLNGMRQEQLVACKQQLEKMLQQIESGQVPPLEKRESGMGRMIADEWPRAKLGDVLSEAEQAYTRLR